MSDSQTKLVLGTRKSQLALAQARAWVKTLLAANKHIYLDVEELHIVTTGDRVTDRPLQEIGGKGLFLKEIEEALVDRRADFAVHSVKDVPAELAKGLVLAAIPPREDARDVLVSKTGAKFRELPAGARVGTSSLRRIVFLRSLRPDLVYLPIRGNVDTRLKKAKSADFEAVVLAMAGMKRLGLHGEVTEIFDPADVMPAIGQGALGIECREGDAATIEILRRTHDEETSRAVHCERGVMLAVEGSCQIPVSAYASREGETMRVRAMLANPDGTNPKFAEASFPWPKTDQEATTQGISLGEWLETTQSEEGGS